MENPETDVYLCIAAFDFLPDTIENAMLIIECLGALAFEYANETGKHIWPIYKYEKNL